MTWIVTHQHINKAANIGSFTFKDTITGAQFGVGGYLNDINVIRALEEHDYFKIAEELNEGQKLLNEVGQKWNA